MAKNFYKFRACAYCGKVTGQNEGEHALPDCIYPTTTDPKLQRLKVAACPDCNDKHQPDEAHFKAMIAAGGWNPSPGRLELIQESLRSFRKKPYGDHERRALHEQVVWTKVLDQNGNPILMTVPHKDERVCHVVKKIVRGLAHTLDWKTTFPEERVVVMKHWQVAEYEDLFDPVYQVREVNGHLIFDGRVAAIYQNRHYPKEVCDMVHSVWQLHFYDVSLTGMIFNRVPSRSQ